MRRKVIQRKIKSAIRGYSRVEELVRKATCSDPWGPSSTQLLQVAQCASSYTDIEQIMRVLWKRLLAGGRSWLYVYKTLIVLEYLIKYGVDAVIEQCQSNRVYLATFLHFDTVQTNLSRRQVSLIRDRAQSILDLLDDSQYRFDEQERLHRIIGGLNSTLDLHGLRSANMQRSVSLDPVRGHTLYTARGAHSSQDIHPYHAQHASAPDAHNSGRPRHSSGGLHSTPQPSGTVQEDEELELQMRVAMALSLAESHKREHSNWQHFDTDSSSSQVPPMQTEQITNHLDALPLEPDEEPCQTQQQQHQHTKLCSHSTCTPSPSVLNEILGTGELPQTEHLNEDPWAPLSDSGSHNPVPELGDPIPCDSMKPTGSLTVYEELALVDFTRTSNHVDGVGDATETTTTTPFPQISATPSTNPFLNEATIPSSSNGASVDALTEQGRPTNPGQVAGSFLGEYSKLVDLENLMHPQFLLPGRLREQNKSKALSLAALKNEKSTDVKTGKSFVPDNQSVSFVPNSSSLQSVTHYPNMFTFDQATNSTTFSKDIHFGTAAFPTGSSSLGLLIGSAHHQPQTLSSNPFL
ncbi:hypothetical protein D915_006409 [Fasciola hepatica]|uniref:ENTH domain-containing protein n=1 Tax=Fasciola hepatica TaxID=6192 RepID=A0A4E0R3N8_FASHE|nr:hypothetical protein D915_006409 [Fasciola hepatica]